MNSLRNMMRKLISILVFAAAVMLMDGCDLTHYRQIQENDPDKFISTSMPKIMPVTYNGHEYLIVHSYYGCGIIHSESCRCKQPENIVVEPEKPRYKVIKEVNGRDTLLIRKWDE